MLKQERIKDKSWLAFAKNMTCIVCGRRVGVVMHHLRTGCQCGTSLKSPDNFCLPLCSTYTIGEKTFLGCHDKIHKNEKKFIEEHHDIFNGDAHKFANVLYERYFEMKSKKK